MKPFSEQYWINRYAHGDNSGPGSYNRLAEFKAEIVNEFLSAHPEIKTVIEHGCGDGNQLSLCNYPEYLGFDVSRAAIRQCERRFAGDPSRRFAMVSDYDGERADLCVSLDVIFHLIEDETFDRYMRRLFDSAKRYVIIYSSNKNETGMCSHVKHRRFTDWVADNVEHAEVIRCIANRYPYCGDGKNESFCDFFIYKLDGEK